MSEQPPVDLDVIRARRTQMELTYGDVAALVAEVERLRQEQRDAALAEVERLHAEAQHRDDVAAEMRRHLAALDRQTNTARAELTAVRIDRDEWRERAQTLHRTAHDREAGE